MLAGAGGMARALPAEAVSVPVSPSAVVAVSALSDGDDYSAWQQQQAQVLDLY